mmetsp:Transcript_15091/g.40585  ORF Transcript_15091/g.40585 Transcript_15091/m.40585 type:complete len:254 (-) Transcript_15091:688-1449(-)
MVNKTRVNRVLGLFFLFVVMFSTLLLTWSACLIAITGDSHPYKTFINVNAIDPPPFSNPVTDRLITNAPVVFRFGITAGFPTANNAVRLLAGVAGVAAGMFFALLAQRVAMRKCLWVFLGTAVWVAVFGFVVMVMDVVELGKAIDACKSTIVCPVGWWPAGVECTCETVYWYFAIFTVEILLVIAASVVIALLALRIKHYDPAEDELYLGEESERPVGEKGGSRSEEAEAMGMGEDMAKPVMPEEVREEGEAY